MANWLLNTSPSIFISTSSLTSTFCPHGRLNRCTLSVFNLWQYSLNRCTLSVLILWQYRLNRCTLSVLSLWLYSLNKCTLSVLSLWQYNLNRCSEFVTVSTKFLVNYPAWEDTVRVCWLLSHCHVTTGSSQRIHMSLLHGWWHPLSLA